MVKGMLSVVVPDRNGQPYLQKTIDDILVAAEGPIEVIIAIDGVWPDPPLKDDKRVKIVFSGTVHDNVGMREGINRGFAIAQGEYFMKTDEHTMFDKGFDIKLKADCEDDWVVIPRRYRLDGDLWEVQTDGRPPVDYMAIDYPYQRPFDKTCGLHGAEWKRPERNSIPIDDTPTMQGSCYFTMAKYWHRLFPSGLDEANYGTFTQEAQEISMPVWLSGGRVVVNKKTWYAHMHKGKKGKGYGFSNEQYKQHMIGTEKGRIYCIEKWLSTKDYLHNFDWFINEKFPTMPGWGTDWRERIKRDKESDYSRSKYV